MSRIRLTIRNAGGISWSRDCKEPKAATSADGHRGGDTLENHASTSFDAGARPPSWRSPRETICATGAPHGLNEHLRKGSVAPVLERRSSSDPMRLPIRHRGPWRDLQPVEFATLECVHCFNHRRILETIGNRAPAEADAAYHRQRDHTALAA